MTRRPLFFYGWIIVGIGVISTILIYGTRHSFSIFFPPILAEFGWNRGDTAFMFSLNLLVYGLVSPFAGSLGDRWKAKWVILIGLTVLVLALAGCAFARELWHFYLLFGFLVPAGTSFSGWPLLGPTLAKWFTRRRGLALGIGQSGSGLAYVMYGIFADFLITHIGWRFAYLVFAGILAAVLVPVYLFLFYSRPEDKELKPYGSDTMSVAPVSGNAIQSGEDGWSLAEALRTRQLWLLALSQFLFWGIASYLVLAHQVKFTLEAGYTSTFAAIIYSLFGIFMSLGLLSGFISDRLGREWTMTLAVLLPLVAFMALLSVRDASQPWLLYVFAIGGGFGAGLYLPTFNASLADMYHGRHFGAIVGITLAGFGIGGVIGPWLGGYIYDRTGSYTSAFMFALVCLVLSLIVFWLAAPRHAARLKARLQS